MPEDRVEIDRDRLDRRISVAQGKTAGDVVLTGGRVVNVFTERIEPANVVIADGFIAGVGPFDWDAPLQIDVDGAVVIPSLIDAHIHVESTLLLPGELARVIVPRGTSTLISDPHEIANVHGLDGIRLLLSLSVGLPLDIFFMAPSCVPAIDFEHAGAVLGVDEIATLHREAPRVLGLAEMMNFPGVLSGAEGVLDKLVDAQRAGRVIDGHAPGVRGREIVAYAAAGVRSDHESIELDEVIAKADLGMLIQVREGSSAKSLDRFMPLLVEDRLGDWCLCTDDIHPDDLRAHGHLDHLLRRIIAAGVPAPRAVRHATLVPARHYRLDDRGAVAPGYRAHLTVVSDLETFSVREVLHDGRLVAHDGALVERGADLRMTFENSVHLAPIDESAFDLAVGEGPQPVIGIVPDQIVTNSEHRVVASVDGRWQFDPNDDVCLIGSIERHRGITSVGLALVSGFGFVTDGAIGSSVAHDSHNLIVAGTNAADLLACVRAMAETGGGFVVARDAALVARLPLPVAGLMSDRDVEEVCHGLDEVRSAARSMGCSLTCPFGTLSFLALSVIPELKITDQGLYDVLAQSFVGS